MRNEVNAMFFPDDIWVVIKDNLFLPRIMKSEIQDIIKGIAISNLVIEHEYVDPSITSIVVVYFYKDCGVKTEFNMEFCDKCGEYVRRNADHSTPIISICFCDLPGLVFID